MFVLAMRPLRPYTPPARTKWPLYVCAPNGVSMKSSLWDDPLDSTWAWSHAANFNDKEGKSNFRPIFNGFTLFFNFSKINAIFRGTRARISRRVVEERTTTLRKMPPIHFEINLLLQPMRYSTAADEQRIKWALYTYHVNLVVRQSYCARHFLMHTPTIRCPLCIFWSHYL